MNVPALYPETELGLLRPKSIGRWVLLRLAMVLFVLGALFSLISIALLDQRFDVFDEDHYKQELRRISVAFELEQASMAAFVDDYGHWDAAEAFVHGKNPNFIEANFTADSAINLGNTAFVITQTSGTVFASQMLTASGILADTPVDMLSKIQPYLTTIAQQNFQKAYVSLQSFGDQFFLCSVAPITDTAKKHPASGYIFFLRLVDKRYLDKLQRITATRFSLNPVPTSQDKTFSIIKSQEDGKEHWEVTQPLLNWPATISVSGFTQLTSEREATYLTVGINALLLMLVSLGAIYWILHYRLLNRLHVFSALANRYRVDDDTNIRWPVYGSDELDNLGRSLNGLIAKVGTQHQNLRHISEHDPLTGIGNRRLFLDRLAAIQNHGRRIPVHLSSLLLLDLDGFKVINDALGHAVGDEVLKVVADRLMAPVRNYDTVARLGGDEFAILLESLEPSEVGPFVQRLLDAVEQPMTIADQVVRVGASVGVAPVSVTLSSDQILRHADLAMYEAKRLGKGRWVQYDESLGSIFGCSNP